MAVTTRAAAAYACWNRIMSTISSSSETPEMASRRLYKMLHQHRLAVHHVDGLLRRDTDARDQRGEEVAHADVPSAATGSV